MASGPADAARPTHTRVGLLYALAGVQLVVTLGWMTYGCFQGPLLERLGFGWLTGLLSLYLGLAGATVAPLVGGIGDRIARRGGARAPLVVAGGLLAGATFVAVASIIVLQPRGVLRLVLVGLVLAWIAGSELAAVLIVSHA